jgi:hypothetical protein
MNTGTKRRARRRILTTSQNNQTKRRVSNRVFDRRIKIWSLVVQVIAAIIAGYVALLIAYYPSQLKVENKITMADQIAVNDLSDQIRSALFKYIESSNSNEKETLKNQLNVLSEQEAGIMRKYNPFYRPRSPYQLPLEGRDTFPSMPKIIPIDDDYDRTIVFLLLFTGLFSISLIGLAATRWILKRRYGMI